MAEESGLASTMEMEWIAMETESAGELIETEVL
jgi:hypothetical protein